MTVRIYATRASQSGRLLVLSVDTVSICFKVRIRKTCREMNLSFRSSWAAASSDQTGKIGGTSLRERKRS